MQFYVMTRTQNESKKKKIRKGFPIKDVSSTQQDNVFRALVTMYM